MGTDRTAKAVSVENFHTCAILDDNSVKCWGYNSNGQLGYGDNVNRNAPEATDTVALGEGRGAVAIDASSTAHVCAILDDNTLKCWGNNSNGQLGDGTTNNSNVPVVVEF